jgi:selenophosphate synthetase-related protein
MEILEKVNITTRVVGDITSDRKLYLSSGNDKKLVFDFDKDKIMGITEEKP